VLLLVFVLQNTVPVKVSFFAADGSVPLGVLVLFAAVAGVLVAAVFASLRILQIRRRSQHGGVGLMTTNQEPGILQVLPLDTPTSQ
jgi:uncharacterized integral membrane protein